MVLGIVLALMGVWVVVPHLRLVAEDGPVRLFAGLALGALHILRLARWCGWATRSEPLLFTLHIAYGFVGLGFLLAGLAAFGLVPAMSTIHSWTVGAIGAMTLTVMSRATLGHSGRPLKAGWVETAFLAALPLAALSRIASTFPAAPLWTLHLSATLWIVGFALFALRYAPVMIAPRHPA